MAEVELNVGGRGYAIDCADEHVARVRGLAEEISREVEGLGEQGAGARGILIAALMMIDRERAAAEAAAQRADLQAEEARRATVRIDALAGRLEEVASSLRERPRAGAGADAPEPGRALAASGRRG